MEKVLQAELKERYTAAVDSFISKVKDDHNVIAVIIYGSLAYDLLWEKSDIDMELIVRDQQLKNCSYSIIEDGITINVNLAARSEFNRWLGKAIGGSIGHSILAKGKIVYTTDESLYEIFENNKVIGSDDIALAAFQIANWILLYYEKSQKWLKARKDPLYAQYFLCMAAEAVANMELCLHGEPSARDSIQKAAALNPEIMKIFYFDTMSHHMSEEEILYAIDKLDNYLEQHLDIIKKPVIEFMADQQIKTVTLLSKHFNMDSHVIGGIFDYLCDKGVIEKVSQMIRITPKSKLSVEEIGYLYIP
jgi:predicted nucleotidyltransferase